MRVALAILVITLLSGCGEKYIKSTDGETYRVIEKCDVVENPNYGQTQTTDLLIGATLGGVIGNKIGDGGDGATAFGAAIGAIAASEPRYHYINCREELREL